MNSPERSTDHDLLVTIHTKLERAIEDIRDLKEGTTSRITDLENTKAEKVELATMKADFENRLKWLERIAYGGIGILAFVEFYFKFVSQ